MQTRFQWLTGIRITEKNAEKIAGAGRKRWKIENEGFNRQKNWQGDITHACSWDATAMKNHYLMVQIADMVKQLYEWFFLKKNGIKKCNAALYSRQKKHFIFDSTNTITALPFR